MEITLLLSTLETFVDEVCNAGFRKHDTSHGLVHAKKVTSNALIISFLQGLGPQSNTVRLVAIVAMLHDVADHKYDKDGSLKAKVKTL